MGEENKATKGLNRGAAKETLNKKLIPFRKGIDL